MKRYIALLSAALLLTVMCSGCTTNRNTTSPAAPSPVASVASEIAEGVSSIASAAEEGVESIGDDMMDNADEGGTDTASPAASK